MTEREIFVTAYQRTDPVERADFLDDACGPDLGLRCRVENLLRLAEGAGSFLEESPAPLPLGVDTATFTPGKGSPTAGHDESISTGDVIAGKYKLVEQIGEGGMGAVYLAQQTEPVKRLVALKVIKAGMDSRQVLARFEAERQALALMDHPNIARVLDGGATPERPAVLRHGAGQGRADHQVLRRAQADAARAAGTVRAGVPGDPARAPEGDHPPRHQAVQRAGRALRRQAGAEGDRLRRGQGRRASR